MTIGGSSPVRSPVTRQKFHDWKHREQRAQREQRWLESSIFIDFVAWIDQKSNDYSEKIQKRDFESKKPSAKISAKERHQIRPSKKDWPRPPETVTTPRNAIAIAMAHLSFARSSLECAQPAELTVLPCCQFWRHSPIWSLWRLWAEQEGLPEPLKRILAVNSSNQKRYNHTVTLMTSQLSSRVSCRRARSESMWVWCHIKGAKCTSAEGWCVSATSGIVCVCKKLCAVLSLSVSKFWQAPLTAARCSCVVDEPRKTCVRNAAMQVRWALSNGEQWRVVSLAVQFQTKW